MLKGIITESKHSNTQYYLTGLSLRWVIKYLLIYFTEFAILQDTITTSRNGVS